MGTLKIYRWAWFALIVVTIATIAVLVIRTSHHDLAAAPDNIEKIVKVDLPEIASVESENNLDRGASRWDTYIHSGQFAEELSEETIKAIEKLCVADRSHWCKEEEYYAYVKDDYRYFNSHSCGSSDWCNCRCITCFGISFLRGS